MKRNEKIRITISESVVREQIRNNFINETVSQNTDREYLEAVQAGDMKKAGAMVRDAANRAGYTIEAYHGTDWGGFTVFGAEDYDRHEQNLQGIYFFNDSRMVALDYADYYEGDELYDGMTEEEAQTLGFSEGVYHVYIKMTHPYKYDADYRYWMSLNYDDWFSPAKDRISTITLAKKIKKTGKYDGLIIFNVKDTATLMGKSDWSTDFVVFDPGQIKLADPVTYDDQGNIIPLSKRFSNSNDIRYEEE